MNLTFKTNREDNEKTDSGLTIAQVKVLCEKLKIADLESREIWIDPPCNIIQGIDARMPSNAVIVSTSYPYGSFRCVRALWQEFRAKYGYRTVTCTSNKYHTAFNANKNGTYSMGMAYFNRDGEDHYQAAVYRLNVYEINYFAKKDLESPESKHGENLRDFLHYNQDILTDADKKFGEFYLNNYQKALAKFGGLTE